MRYEKLMHLWLATWTDSMVIRRDRSRMRPRIFLTTSYIRMFWTYRTETPTSWTYRTETSRPGVH